MKVNKSLSVSIGVMARALQTQFNSFFYPKLAQNPWVGVGRQFFF